MSADPRVEAVKAVDRVLRSGAYSNVLAARVSGFESKGHASFQRLLYSTLRWLPHADRRITEAAGERRIDPLVRATLRTAITDAAVLGTPDHAVVSEYVDLIRQLGLGRASGFVNAVLRAVLREGLPMPERLEDAYPNDIVEIVTGLLDAAAVDFLWSSNEPAEVGVHVPGSTAGGSGVPGSWYVPAAEVDDALGEHPDLRVIDPASAAVAIALDAADGHRVLDVAAAPGGKTLIISDAVGSDGLVVACDVHSRRTRSARTRTARAGAPIEWMIADGRQLPVAGGSFDRVLLDAPCTGLGTLRRRPEIRYRVELDAPARYGKLQRELLHSAMGASRPGGRLVYSVCTVSREETIEVIDGLGFRPPEGLPGQRFGDGLLMAPHLTGTDGMFIAVKDV